MYLILCYGFCFVLFGTGYYIFNSTLYLNQFKLNCKFENTFIFSPKVFLFQTIKQITCVHTKKINISL